MSEVKDIDWYTLAGVGIIGGLICIYAAVLLNVALGVNYFIFLGAVGAILATVWGADAVRKICKYGIGTGVPSIGMLAFGMGLLCTLLGLKVGDWLAAKYLTATIIDTLKLGVLVGPIAALVLALVQGYVIGFSAQNILKMKIPTMQIGMTMISGAASLIYMGYTVTIAGDFLFGTMVDNVINTGFIAPLFMVGALPMLHQFNAYLGPDENKRRTLVLGVESALMSMVIFGILSFAIFPNDIVGSVITIVLGLVALFFAYMSYWQKVKESGTTILATGLLPKKEEGQ